MLNDIGLQPAQKSRAQAVVSSVQARNHSDMILQGAWHAARRSLI